MTAPLSTIYCVTPHINHNISIFWRDRATDEEWRILCLQRDKSGPSGTQLIQHCANSRQSLPCRNIVRPIDQCFSIFITSNDPLVLCFIPASEVDMRKTVAFVSWSFQGQIEPLNRLIDLSLLQQISTDLVVRISKFGIHFDGLSTFLNGII